MSGWEKETSQHLVYPASVYDLWAVGKPTSDSLDKGREDGNEESVGPHFDSKDCGTRSMVKCVCLCVYCKDRDRDRDRDREREREIEKKKK